MSVARFCLQHLKHVTPWVCWNAEHASHPCACQRVYVEHCAAHRPVIGRSASFHGNILVLAFYEEILQHIGRNIIVYNSFGQPGWQMGLSTALVPALVDCPIQAFNSRYTIGIFQRVADDRVDSYYYYFYYYFPATGRRSGR